MVRKFLKRLQNILCKALVAVLFILAINDKPVIGEPVAQVLQGIVLFLIAPIQTMQFMPVLFRGINLVQPFLQWFPWQVEPDLNHMHMVLLQVMFKRTHLLNIAIKQRLI